MQADFNSLVALLYSGLIAGAIFLYIAAMQPATRLAPRRVRQRLQQYYSRFIFMSSSLLHARAFDLKQKGDRIDPVETAVIVLNHQSILDYFLVALMAKQNGLDSNCFFYIDKQLVRFPTLRGIVERMRRHGNWALSPKRLGKAYNIVHEASKKHASWIVIFPEVNRFSPRRLHEHQILTYSAGAPRLNHLLYPRLDSTCQAIQYLRVSTITAVYDLTVEYSAASQPARPVVPTLLEAALSNKEWVVVVSVRRYGISTIPSDRKALEKWIEKRWYQKDSYLEKQARKAAKLKV